MPLVFIRIQHKAIKRIDINQTRTIDIGRCNDKYFCNNIAAGVIPKVIEEVTPKEKSILGPLAYFLRAGQALFTNKGLHIPHQNRERRFYL